MSTITTTVTGSWPLINGQMATGRVLIEPHTEGVTPGSIIPRVGVAESLTAGAFSVALTTIDGLQLDITEQINDADNPVPYTVTCHGGTLDLSIAPRSAPTPASLYLLASEVGQPGGLVPLDDTGHVEQRFLPSTAAGVQSVTATNGTVLVDNTDPQNPKVVIGAIPESAVIGLLSDLATLASSIAGKAPAARNIGTTGGLTGGGDLTADRMLGISYGTTINTAAQGNDGRIVGAVQSSIFTTKGDLLAATGAGALVRLPVGTDGQVLTADSSQTAGTRWAPASGGGGGTTVNKIRQRYVSGTLNPPLSTGGNWQQLMQADPGGGSPGPFEIAIAAQAGWDLDAGYSAMMEVSPGTVYDLAIRVGSTLVYFFSTWSGTPSSQGDPTFYPIQAGATFLGHAAPDGLTLDSSHIDVDGKVHLVMGYNSNGTGKFYAESELSFRWWAATSH